MKRRIMRQARLLGKHWQMVKCQVCRRTMGKQLVAATVKGVHFDTCAECQAASEELAAMDEICPMADAGAIEPFSTPFAPTAREIAERAVELGESDKAAT